MSQHYGMVRTKVSPVLTAGAGVVLSAPLTVGNLNGLLQEVLISAPGAVDAAATVTVNVTDADGYVVYTSAALAAGASAKDLVLANATFKSPIPLSGSYSVQTTYSVAQPTTSSTTNVTFLVQQVG